MDTSTNSTNNPGVGRPPDWCGTNMIADEASSRWLLDELRRDRPTFGSLMDLIDQIWGDGGYAVIKLTWTGNSPFLKVGIGTAKTAATWGGQQDLGGEDHSPGGR